MSGQQHGQAKLGKVNLHRAAHVLAKFANFRIAQRRFGGGTVAPDAEASHQMASRPSEDRVAIRILDENRAPAWPQNPANFSARLRAIQVVQDLCAKNQVNALVSQGQAMSIHADVANLLRLAGQLGEGAPLFEAFQRDIHGQNDRPPPPNFNGVTPAAAAHIQHQVSPAGA